MSRLIYWLKGIKLGIRAIFRFNLGDEVIYRGKWYTLISGVIPGKWRIGRTSEGHEWWVSETELVKVVSVQNYIHSFNMMRNWYMTSWYDIEVRNAQMRSPLTRFGRLFIMANIICLLAIAVSVGVGF